MKLEMLGQQPRSIPSPPPARTHWPWTMDLAHRLASAVELTSWPRVTIVTPSYNQAPFLEETIRSVLLQDYPNLEYIVIDGGSTDGSVDIIRKYASHVTYWVSEPDRGHPHAVNKGWMRASGDILAFLNSDDVYTPGAISRSVAYLVDHPWIGVVYSSAFTCDDKSTITGRLVAPEFRIDRLLDRNFIHQPTAFVRRNVLDQIGLLDESFYYWFDYEFWLRATCATQFGRLPAESALMRMHPASKTCSKVWDCEHEFARVFDAVFARHPEWQIGRSAARRPYVNGLVYAAGFTSKASPAERADAVKRLQALSPPVSPEEIAAVIVAHDNVRHPPDDMAGTLAHETTYAGMDSCKILPSLLGSGIISAETGDRIARRVGIHARVRAMRSNRSLSPLDVLRAHANAVTHDPQILRTRGWWALIAKSTSLGRSLLPVFHRVRDLPHSLTALRPGRVS